MALARIGVCVAIGGSRRSALATRPGQVAGRGFPAERAASLPRGARAPACSGARLPEDTQGEIANAAVERVGPSGPAEKHVDSRVRPPGL